MKLFYKPGACSLASHIILHEIGVPFDVEKVDTSTGVTETGMEYSTINVKGYVPTLQMDDGEFLSEGSAILQFLADSYPNADLAPAMGTLERSRMLEQLTFVSSELHKAFGPLFHNSASEDKKIKARKEVARKFNVVEDLLSDQRDTVVNGQFTIADAYLFVVANWANFTGINLDDWPSLAAYVERIGARSSVKSAMQAEGLLQ